MAPTVRPSLPGLLKDLLLEGKTFLRQEAQLAKTEISEKFSQWGGDATWVAIGGVAAYAGFIVVLIALGLLVALGFEHLKIDSSLAMSAGFGAIGLLAAIVGALMLLKASKAFSKESLAPERAIANFQKLRGEPVPIRQKSPPKEKEQKPRSEDIEKRVIATEDRLGRTFEEIERRVTFAGPRRRVSERVRLHPYRCGFLALAMGLAAGFVFTRKLRF
jgi:hypothetical protein